MINKQKELQSTESRCFVVLINKWLAIIYNVVRLEFWIWAEKEVHNVGWRMVCVMWHVVRTAPRGYAIAICYHSRCTHRPMGTPPEPQTDINRRLRLWTASLLTTRKTTPWYIDLNLATGSFTKIFAVRSENLRRVFLFVLSVEYVACVSRSISSY